MLGKRFPKRREDMDPALRGRPRDTIIPMTTNGRTVDQYTYVALYDARATQASAREYIYIERLLIIAGPLAQPFQRDSGPHINFKKRCARIVPKVLNPF
jgi:hypothetical protein